MNKRLLNIKINNPKRNQDYIDFLSRKFTINVLDVTDKSRPDLIVFTGGADVNPAYYNQNMGKYTSIDKNRDDLDDSLYNMHDSMFNRNQILKLGICRGAQYLTVKSGGSLIQHVENHSGGLHNIDTDMGQVYKITSTHHQMMNPFNLNKDNYDLLAYSSKFLSPIYLNGDNENIEEPNDFLEPEIVYYKNTRSLCIQGHPEYRHCPDNTVEYCLNLIEERL